MNSPHFRCGIVLTAVISLLINSCSGGPADAFFNSIAANDRPLDPTHPGDWRYEHHENSQSLQAYQRNVSRQTIDSGKQIVLLPIGNFSALQLQLLNDARNYASVFFQRPVSLLAAISDADIPAHARRQRSDKHEQFLASYIVDSLLPPYRNDSNFAVMAITAADLYPQPEWNFVFGLASYVVNVGVSSIYRLQDDSLTAGNYATTLLRLNKIASHEISHMLGLHHCQDAQCVINGSNRLGETDNHPARACSNCQRKLYWGLRYDNRKRLEQLQQYFRKNGQLQEGAYCRTDLSSLD